MLVRPLCTVYLCAVLVVCMVPIGRAESDLLENVHSAKLYWEQLWHAAITQRRHQPIRALAQSSLNDAFRLRRNVFTIKQDLSQKHTVASEEKAATNSSSNTQRPRFNLSRNTIIPFDPYLYRCRDKLSPPCQNRTQLFREKVVSEFQRALAASANGEPNYYNVNYAAVLRNTDTKPANSPICMLLGAKVRTLRKKDEPFNQNDIGNHFPKRKLFKNIAKNEAKTSCAIVSSAGSLAKSGLGHFVDLHDIVMRFNHAPVEGYVSDVGRKSTIRVVNSQVVTKPEFNFIESPMFRNVSLAAWDPGKFNGSLSEWIAAPDFNLFENYKTYMKNWPTADFHLVDPRSIWNLWKALQIYTKTNVRWNPPSSGFIGLALLLPVCSYVDFIEYIPSTRLSGRCHYYDEKLNPACTFGSWHPLAAEKLMAIGMNSADDFTVFQNGVIRIRRPEKGAC